MQKQFHFNEILETAYNQGAHAYHNNWLQPHIFIEPEREEFLKRLPKNGKILDIGCGPGQDAEYFSNLGFKVTGVDVSEEFIRIASSRAPQANFIKMDMRNLNFPDEEFDGVWSSFSFLHIAAAEAEKTLHSILRVLKAKGLLFISCHAAEKTQSRLAPVAGLLDEEKKQLSVYFQEWSLEDFKFLLERAGVEILVFRPFTRLGGQYPLLSTLSTK